MKKSENRRVFRQWMKEWMKTETCQGVSCNRSQNTDKEKILKTKKKPKWKKKDWRFSHRIRNQKTHLTSSKVTRETRRQWSNAFKSLEKINMSIPESHTHPTINQKEGQSQDIRQDFIRLFSSTFSQASTKGCAPAKRERKPGRGKLWLREAGSNRRGRKRAVSRSAMSTTARTPSLEIRGRIRTEGGGTGPTEGSQEPLQQVDSCCATWLSKGVWGGHRHTCRDRRQRKHHHSLLKMESPSWLSG